MGKSVEEIKNKLDELFQIADDVINEIYMSLQKKEEEPFKKVPITFMD